MIYCEYKLSIKNFMKKLHKITFNICWYVISAFKIYTKIYKYTIGEYYF